MYLYVLLEVDGEEGRPTPPNVAPGEPNKGPYAPVRWEARYVTREDPLSGLPAVLVFLDLDQAIWYAGRLLADGSDVAIISTTDAELQERAFGGDAKGQCILDASTEHPPGLAVDVGYLAEWFRIEDETRGE